MKLTDMFISALIKRGVLYEARNVDVEFIIPQTYMDKRMEYTGVDAKIHFKAEHMTIKVEKEEKKEA
jgi:DUF917 family protein